MEPLPRSTSDPVKVELLRVAKSAWNFQTFNAPEAGSIFIKKFGEPAGGAVAPSKSEGRRLAKVLES
jgi:hypothetical protein